MTALLSPGHPTSINSQWSSAISADEDEDFKLFFQTVSFSYLTVRPFFFFFCSCDVALVFLTDLTFHYRLSFTTKAVKAFTDSCWLVMQRVSTAERSNFLKKKPESSTSPKDQFRCFPSCCWWNLLLRIWLEVNRKGETACRCCREYVGEISFISVIYKWSLNHLKYFYHDVRHMLRNHGCFNS